MDRIEQENEFAEASREENNLRGGGGTTLRNTNEKKNKISEKNRKMCEILMFKTSN